MSNTFPFHGGCFDCINYSALGEDFCVNCMYYKPDLSLPDLHSERNPTGETYNKLAKEISESVTYEHDPTAVTSMTSEQYEKWAKKIDDKYSTPKERKPIMSYIVKVIRRAILLWVFYGAFKLYMFARPLVIKLAYAVDKVMDPEDIPNPIEAEIVGIAIVMIALALLFFGTLAYNRLARWIFNESSKKTHNM